MKGKSKGLFRYTKLSLRVFQIQVATIFEPKSPALGYSAVEYEAIILLRHKSYPAHTSSSHCRNKR